MIVRKAWDLDGVIVSSIVQADMAMNTFIVRGTALNVHDKPFDWLAMVTPQGWLIEVQGARGPESFQGLTFNLPLEVARAVRRTL